MTCLELGRNAVKNICSHLKAFEPFLSPVIDDPHVARRRLTAVGLAGPVATCVVAVSAAVSAKRLGSTVVPVTCRLRAAVFAFAVAAVALTPVAVAGDSSASGFGKGGWTSVFEGTDAIAPQANG